MTEIQGQLSFTDDISRDLELQEYGLDPAVDSTLLPNAAVMSALQNLVRLATELCGAPFGVVNIISAEYQHQIGAWGVDPGSAPAKTPCAPRSSSPARGRWWRMRPRIRASRTIRLSPGKSAKSASMPLFLCRQNPGSSRDPVCFLR